MMPRPARQYPASGHPATARPAGDAAAPSGDRGQPSMEDASNDMRYWADSGPARALQARLDDHFALAADEEKLSLRTRVAVIVGVSMGLWSLILGGLALLMGR